jgi:catalase (peroxidase I)
VVLLKQQWTKVQKYPGGPEQFMNPADDLMMLPSDMSLLSDAKFRYVCLNCKYCIILPTLICRPLVELYAKDKQIFFQDFAKAFAKLLALGVRNQSSAAITNVCPAQGRL